MARPLRQKKALEARERALALLPGESFGETPAYNSGPPRYTAEYAEQVRAAASVGYTHSELARLLGVSLDTINLWRVIYPAFEEALRINSQARSDRVEAALYQRAVGYEQPSEKVFYNPTTNMIVRAEVVTHIPAEISAAKTWLEVHGPDGYAKSAEKGTTVNVGVNVNVNTVRASIEGKLAGLAAKRGLGGVPGLIDAGRADDP